MREKAVGVSDFNSEFRLPTSEFRSESCGFAGPAEVEDYVKNMRSGIILAWIIGQYGLLKTHFLG